ncbi:MFS transporter [Agrococcus jejuensis]|uniref:MFS transporter n=1 Tax=Agrococcus jejuensis TaxID=399736 RepID=UPI00119E7290|nr:MFS transporter [Agrococcus jejuensis]
MTITTGTRTGTAWQAVIVAASFAMLLAGTNAINPLLPVYRDLLGLDPLLISLTFVCYVGVLVVVLLVLARPTLTRFAAPLLVAALAVAIGSDVLLAIAQEWSVLAGRAVAGIAGGMGTGAAAALVVAAIGARGRAISATGNLVGAVVGAGGSQLVVSFAEAGSPQLVALGHASVLAILLVAASIVLRARRDANRAALVGIRGGRASIRLDRRVVRMLASGSVGWIGVSVGIVFGATIFAELEQPVARALGPVLMLAASAAAQLASPMIARVAPWASGLLVQAAGALGVAAGALWSATPVVLAGYALLGVGIGISYRAGLVALTRGATPAQQGALSSLYAAVTYAAAAVAVLLVGGIGNLSGVVPAAIGAFALVGVASLATALVAPRLRDTAEPRRAS